MSYWCELAWLGGERVEAGALLSVEDGRVASLELGVAAPPAEATRLDGITIPGFANAHSHAFQRALRGRAQERGSFWTWRERMYELAGRLDPDGYLALAGATFTEMALAGITVVGEFHYLHHGPGGNRYADPNAMGRAVIEAARQVGVRITLLDTCYLHGGIGEPLAPGQERFSDGDAEAWIERVDELEDAPGLRIGAAIHSIRAVDPESARRVAEWAGERPLHAHVSEQPAENEACFGAYGSTPTEVLATAGALDRAFTGERGIHQPADLLRHATAGGYESLGWDAAGFEPGMLADLVTVGLDSVRLADADRDQLCAALVFSATAADVRKVIVGGELIIQ
jgi:formiminoglutamate deiminase